MEKKYAWALAVIAAVLSFFADSCASSLAVAVKNPFLDYLMSWLTNINTLIMVPVIMAALFLWKERKGKWIMVLCFSFVTTALIGTAIKLIIARPRPIPFDVIMTSFSFPSMHAALAFAVLPVLEREFPKLRWFWWTFAILTAVSRVYLGVHYLSDIMAGALFGYAIGSFFVIFQEREIKKAAKWKKKQHSK